MLVRVNDGCVSQLLAATSEKEVNALTSSMCSVFDDDTLYEIEELAWRKVEHIRAIASLKGFEFAVGRKIDLDKLPTIFDGSPHTGETFRAWAHGFAVVAGDPSREIVNYDGYARLWDIYYSLIQKYIEHPRHPIGKSIYYRAEILEDGEVFLHRDLELSPRTN